MYMVTHLSNRLVWHDDGWNGCICIDPLSNTSCMVHDYIRESRDDDKEARFAGAEMHDIDFHPPCMTDISLFSKQPSDIIHNDPLDWRNLPHIEETLPSFSFCARPYGRMFSEEEGVTWENDPYEQKLRLDYFFEQIEEGSSLVFFYTNHGNPLMDKAGDRLLLGLARIVKKGPQHYFPKKGKYQEDYPLWSRALTIDPEESFFIPYQEYLKKDADCTNIISGIPNSIRGNYSYVSEHLSDDVAVISLESLIEVARTLQEEQVVHEDWESKIDWLDRVLGEAWKSRGAYPGIGAILNYLEFKRGYTYQYQVLNKISNEGLDAWEHVVSILEGKKDPEQDYRQYYQEAKNEWKESEYLQKLLSKLALFELSSDQVKRVANSILREKSEITASIEEIIDNPYLLCEQDIGGKDSAPIGFEKIDHGMIPLPGMSELWGMRAPISTKDRRRVRALIAETLRQAASEGHTLLPLNEVLERIMKRFSEERACEPDPERILSQKEFYSEIIEFGSDEKKSYLALKSIRELERVIADTIKELVTTPDYLVDEIDWQEKLEQEYGKVIDQKEEEIEKKARREKAVALDKMYRKRLSILTGRAGTGKTSLTSVLLKEIREREGNTDILLLAPTGKARIRLQEKTSEKAKTIHQFLFHNGWINKDTYTFNKSGVSQTGASTIVIDESSMIPIDLLGTLFKAIRFNDVKRLIMVGDPNQLPPIGPGRPFIDTINWVKTSEYSENIANLRERRRQRAVESNALRLSDGYVSEYPEPNDDQILSEISSEYKEGDLEVHFWENEDQLYTQLNDVMRELLSIDDSEKSYVSFNRSLGINSNDTNNTPESWQILSPVKMHRYGTRELNRIIQRQHRSKLLSVSPWSKMPKPFGNEKIVWTDKVIQNRNMSRMKYDGRRSMGYVANGEIGYVKNTKKIVRGSNYLDVCFSTQEDCTYRYYQSEIDDNLELAYAITVHKAQGSDFEYVFLIIPQKARTLSRELIYTGLTRSKEKMIIFIEKDIAPLRILRKMQHSETILRNTNLFELIIMSDKVAIIYPENLIHRTLTGEMVRSKSEVIVANILTNLSLDYEYEKPLEISENDFRLPDFTVMYRGKTFYWEHLGMLEDVSYRKSWEKKLQWYTENGLLEHLITSKDEADGSIDSQIIEQTVKEKILDI